MLDSQARILLTLCLLVLPVGACGEPSTDSDAGGDASARSDASTPDASRPDAATPDAAGPDAGPEPDCAATGTGRCFYVATDGDDSAAGTTDAPFRTFQTALELAAAGDIIYARGGTYGPDNAVIDSLQRLPVAGFPPPCAAGLTEADGFCQVPRLVFASMRDWNGYPLAGDDGFRVASGERGRPITLRNFPGEAPVLDVRTLARATEIEDALIQAQRPAIQIIKSSWVVRGFEVIGGSIDLRGNIEDITIERCDIHDLVMDGGDNPGLIRLNRGPEDVRILDNRLHAIHDYESPGEWSGVRDSQHFGAVTTLSGETYGGTDDTGAIEIRGNEIFNVPQVFFFKNAARGPIEIISNHIYDSGSLASNASANVAFRGNLVHGVRTGIWRQGQGFTERGTMDAAVLAIDGHNLTIEYNTFVGLEDTLVRSSYGDGYVIQNNVIFGLPGTAASAGYDSASFIKIREDGPPAESRLMTHRSDQNCFIVPDAAFQLVARYPSTGPVEHYDLAMARTTFDFDRTSIVSVTAELADAFVDPAGLDYALQPSIACPMAGHTALP